ncbi:MAG: recombination-associated protein RdgC [Archangium sp.]
MGIRRGSVNLARFRVEGDIPKDVKRWLQKGLGKAAFEPIDPKSEQERTAGFVELEANDRTEFSVGNLFHGTHALFAYRVETLKVPTNAVRAKMLEWVQAFEAKNKRGPGRRERADQKEQVQKALRAKQEPSTKIFEVSLDTVSRDLFVWATSRTVVDEVQGSLEANLEVKLIPRVPAAMISPSLIDTLLPTPELFGEV